ncbi:MAG: ATP-binding cassette domain-containing protein [Caldimicrobium sp.]
MIEIKNLVKTYNGIRAVDDVSFTIKEGEIFGLLGQNGAAKTTIIKMHTLFTKPDSGEVRICGFDLNKGPLEIKKNMGCSPFLREGNLS